MMVLVRDVELDFRLDDLTQGAPDTDVIKKLFDFLEFRTLWDVSLRFSARRAVSPLRR